MAGENEQMHDGLDRGVSPDVQGEPVAERPGAVPPAASEAAIDAAETRRKEITQQIAEGKLDAARKAELVSELRQLVAKQTTTEEQKELASAPLAEHREAYGLDAPNLPKNVLADYEENFSGWEQNFLLAARQEGLDPQVVRGVRDDAINLAFQVDGAPLDEAVLDKTLAKYRLTDAQRAGLKKYWRAIEGGETA